MIGLQPGNYGLQRLMFSLTIDLSSVPSEAAVRLRVCLPGTLLPRITVRAVQLLSAECLIRKICFGYMTWRKERDSDAILKKKRKFIQRMFRITCMCI